MTRATIHHNEGNTKNETAHLVNWQTLPVTTEYALPTLPWPTTQVATVQRGK